MRIITQVDLRRTFEHVPSISDVERVLEGFLDMALRGRDFFEIDEFQAFISRDVVRRFTEVVPKLQEAFAFDVEATLRNDPSAEDAMVVVAAHPGFYASAVYRIAHELHQLGVPLVPRMMSEIAHSKTGIEIHPAAKIGSGLFIDHGTGVVIAETTEIGEWVAIDEGVVLDSNPLHSPFPKDEHGKLLHGQKRHPTIGNGVTLLADAKVLGNVTVGDNTTIGHNVVVMEDIPPNVIVELKHPSYEIRPQKGKERALARKEREG